MEQASNRLVRLPIELKPSKTVREDETALVCVRPGLKSRAPTTSLLSRALSETSARSRQCHVLQERASRQGPRGLLDS